MKKLMKITKLDTGFFVENKEGHEFFYVSWQEVADKIFKMLNSTDSKKLFVMEE